MHLCTCNRTLGWCDASAWSLGSSSASSNGAGPSRRESSGAASTLAIGHCCCLSGRVDSSTDIGTSKTGDLYCMLSWQSLWEVSQGDMCSLLAWADCNPPVISELVETLCGVLCMYRKGPISLWRQVVASSFTQVLRNPISLSKGVQFYSPMMLLFPSPDVWAMLIGPPFNIQSLFALLKMAIELPIMLVVLTAGAYLFLMVDRGHSTW